MPLHPEPTAPARVLRHARLRWILPVLLLGLLVTPGAAMAAPDPFSDDDGSPYDDAISALVKDDIVTGCDEGDDRFCPRDPVRRDQAAAMIARAFHVPDTGRDHFDDDDGNVHEEDLNRLASAGIIRGCDGDDACAEHTLRRNQMAAWLARAAEVGGTNNVYFRDTAGVSHRAAINRLAAAGITAGCATRPARFCPDSNVLRGELAVFLARALDAVPRARLSPVRATKSGPRDADRSKPGSGKRADGAKRRRAPADRRSKQTGTTVWDRLARCESGGNWSINTGNGYYGGLQFSLSSWHAVGGSGYPHDASRAEQIRRGKRLKDRQGWGAWPSCTARLGLR